MGELVIAMFLLLSSIGFSPDLALFSQAQTRANDMAEQDYFKHDLGAYSGDYCALGEVLAKSSGRVSAKAVMNAWQRSEPHARVLNESRAGRIGVGVAAGDSGIVWVVAVGRIC